VPPLTARPVDELIFARDCQMMLAELSRAAVGLRVRAPRRPVLPVLGIVVGADLLASRYAVRATEWTVMTDELQTSKLATSISATLSPVPQIHGVYYGALNQLYPLVLAPLYAGLPAEAAFRGAHMLNALLLASSAWPAYLLGRDVTASRAGGYFAAALTAFVPWLVLSATLLTENAAYPAFVWSALLAYRAIAEPTTGRDAAALAGIGLAYLARTQLFVLALALPLAICVHERGVRSAVARHRLLAAAYAVGATAAVVLAAAGALTKVFGSYSATFSGNPFPSGIWQAVETHLDYVVVGTGVAPFILATAWSLTAAAGASPRARAFAVLFLILTPLLTFEAASFDLRFTPGMFAQDRYLAYLAPLFAVGAAACLVDRRRTVVNATMALAVGLSFAALASAVTYRHVAVIFWASPAAAFHDALGSAAGATGLATGDFVGWGVVVIAVCSAGAIWRGPPRLTLSMLGVGLAAFGAFEVAYVFDRFALPSTTRAQTIVGVRRDWIDTAVPARSSVALVPNPELAAEYWWEAEFWNKSVDRALTVDGRPTFTPFAANELSFDQKTGRARDPGLTDLLVLDMTESRFGFAGAVHVAEARPLVLVRVARPYRAAWLVSGTAPDGSLRPGQPAHIRIYDAQNEFAVMLRAPVEANAPQVFELRSGGFVRRGQVQAGGVVRVCLPLRRSVILLGGRLHVDGLQPGACAHSRRQ